MSLTVADVLALPGLECMSLRAGSAGLDNGVRWPYVAENSGIAEWVLGGWRVMIAVSSLSAAERLKDLLSQYGLESNTITDPRPAWRWSLRGRIEIRVTPLSEGFAFPDEKRANPWKNLNACG